jgi:hypothetical protein
VKGEDRLNLPVIAADCQVADGQSTSPPRRRRQFDLVEIGADDVMNTARRNSNGAAGSIGFRCSNSVGEALSSSALFGMLVTSGAKRR